MNRSEIFENAAKVCSLAFKRAGRRCPKWARAEEFKDAFFNIYKKAQYKNKHRFAYGKDGTTYHVDHVVPLVCKDRQGRQIATGLHVPWNLRVIRADINMAKGTMLVHEWLMPVDLVKEHEERLAKEAAQQAEYERHRRIKLAKRKKARQQRKAGISGCGTNKRCER